MCNLTYLEGGRRGEGGRKGEGGRRGREREGEGDGADGGSNKVRERSEGGEKGKGGRRRREQQ